VKVPNSLACAVAAGLAARALRRDREEYGRSHESFPKSRPIRRAVVLLALASACTTVDVNPVPARGYPISLLCIERNPEVVVDDLLAVIEQGVTRHGLRSRIVDAPFPEDCEYTLWYVAHRRWDIRPVLGYVELRVRYRGETIGSATYLSRPSLSPFKWRSTESKIGPVIDALFAQFQS